MADMLRVAWESIAPEPTFHYSSIILSESNSIVTKVDVTAVVRFGFIQNLTSYKNGGQHLNKSKTTHAVHQQYC